MLTDVVQIEADQILLGLSGVVVGHSSSSLDVPGQIVLGADGPVGPDQSGPPYGARQRVIIPDQGPFVKGILVEERASIQVWLRPQPLVVKVPVGSMGGCRAGPMVEPG